VRELTGLSAAECKAACDGFPGCHSHSVLHEEAGCKTNDNSASCFLLGAGCDEIDSSCWDTTHHENVTDFFSPNKTGSGCSNSAEILLGQKTVLRNVQNCAARCMGLLACRQFMYIDAASSHPEAGGCYLFSGECQRVEGDWDLYDIIGQRITSNATFTGFASGKYWTLPTSRPEHWKDAPNDQGCTRRSFQCLVEGVEEMVEGREPSSEHWSEIWKTIVTAPAETDEQVGYQCHREGLVPGLFATAQLGEGGLGSRLNNFANEFLFAMWAGLPVSVCTPPGAHDSWFKYFDYSGFPLCSSCGDNQCTTGACAGAYASRAMNEDNLIQIKRWMYQKLFRFNEEVQKSRADLIKELGIGGSPYVGVHIRRGDKAQEFNDGETFITVETFAQEVRKQCEGLPKANGTCTVFIATDSPEVKAELGAQLTDMQVVSQGDLPPELLNIRNRAGENDGVKQAAEQSFVLDLSMLIAADAFVGTASSNVGRFVFFLRPEDKPSVTLDDAGSFITRNC